MQTAVMDWFSWLSKGNLEPSLIYEYGLVFARNELEKEDVPYFNHEFLQSMGITVAKHRLEIIKLARKESGGKSLNLSFSNLVLKFHKAKRRIAKRIGKWVFHGDPTVKTIQEPSWHDGQMRGAQQSRMMYKDHQERMLVQKHIRPTMSGPLDMRMQEKLGVHNRSLKLSGQLDSRLFGNRSPNLAQDRPMFVNRSPKFSGPLDSRVQERLMFPRKSSYLSGPIDGRVQDRLMYANRSPRFSGPIDGRVQDRLMYVNRSPRFSGPIEGKFVSPMSYDQSNKGKEDGADDDVEEDEYDHLIWTTLFQDMKPT